MLGAFLLDFMGRYDRHNMSWLVIIFHKTFVNYLLYKKFYVIMKSFFRFLLLLLVCAAVGGGSAYYVVRRMQPQPVAGATNMIFNTSSSSAGAAYRGSSAASFAPDVDFTTVAEASVNAVVHVRNQRSAIGVTLETLGEADITTIGARLGQIVLISIEVILAAAAGIVAT